MTSVVPGLMTTEQFLALPDDGVERWLVEGELWEKRIPEAERGVTVRNRVHSRIMVRTAKFLDNWLDGQPEPRGQVLGGEAGVRLSRSTESTVVGVDVVYISSNLLQHQTDETSLIDGVPTLAVEILSPYDTAGEIHSKLAVYQKAGVPQIWVIDPYGRSVTVHRLGASAKLYNDLEELDGGPDLPGFRLAVARLFD